jgi:hypothetical protein
MLIMKRKEKAILYENFLTQWQGKFRQIPFILELLKSYPEFISNLGNINLLENCQVENSQLEWIYLVSQFDNPIETKFFKNSLVPIEKDSYDCFIDISTIGFTLFEAHYWMVEPFCWYKKYIIHDLRNFLLEIDDPKFSMVFYFADVEMEFKFVKDYLIDGSVDKPPSIDEK